MHHLTQKIAVAAGALTLAATGFAAAAGAPPDAADHGLTTAEDHVSVELPAVKDVHPGAPAVEDDATEDDTDDADAFEDDATEDESTDAADAVEAASTHGGTGPVANHGAEVRAVAQGGTTGRAHGEAVSEVARQGHGGHVGATGEAHRADDAGDHGRP